MTLRKFIFFILVIPLIMGVIYLSRAIIAPFIIAFFLAYALNPIVEFFQQKGARRDLAILTVYLIVFIILAMIIEIVVPRLIRDLSAVIQRLPQIFSELQTVQERFSRVFDSWNLPFNLKFVVNELTKRGEAIIRSFLVQLGDGVMVFFSKSLLYALVPLLAYYISRDYPRIKQNIFKWLLKHLGNHWTGSFLKIDSVFKYYIRSQLLDTLIVGGLFSVGLSILGFEAAILLGFTVGIFNLIPYFGPILGAIPLIIMALLKSPWLVLYVIILFVIINQLEVMVFAPRIISGNLGLHPVVVIYLILLGGEIFGLFGMIFAVPLGAILLIIFKSSYEICFGLANNEPISEQLDFNNSKDGIK